MPREDQGTALHLRPRTKSGQDTSGKKVKGVIHWVPVQHAARITVPLRHLFLTENPRDDTEGDFTNSINPDSLITLTDVPVEPAVARLHPAAAFSFYAKGYFYYDRGRPRR